jgi:predicted ATPase
MLTKLSFSNFKSWQDTGEIRLAPITGLFGSNSSGKSSALQMLLSILAPSGSFPNASTLGRARNLRIWAGGGRGSWMRCWHPANPE